MKNKKNIIITLSIFALLLMVLIIGKMNLSVQFNKQVKELFTQSKNIFKQTFKFFKQPTEEEMKHDFLWRVYPHFPAKGMIEVFNRSYYEDIIVPTIEEKLSKEELRHRCQVINGLEQHFELSNTHALKFFLHILKEEQKQRIKERLTQPQKRWKYAKEDEAAADKWADYIEVYDMLINKCNTHPWHIIPADKRWYRNFAVAKVLTNHLESLHLKISLII